MIWIINTLVRRVEFRGTGVGKALGFLSPGYTLWGTHIAPYSPVSQPLRVHQALTKSPVLTAPKAAGLTGLTFPTVLASMRHLEELRIVRELTGKQRDRVFAYNSYVKTLSEGTDPIK